MRTGSVALFAALCLAAACGPKPQTVAATPAPQTEPVPGGFGGDGYGGDMYGGGYGGDAYGGGGYGGGGGAYEGTGVYDCVSGIPECDAVLGKYVQCIRGSAALDEQTRKQTIDALQQACLGIQQAAGDPRQRGDMVSACLEMDKQGAQNAADMGCTW
jgi:hypothetical protein